MPRFIVLAALLALAAVPIRAQVFGASGRITAYGTAAPTAASCDASGEVNSYYLQTGNPATVPTQLWECVQTGVASYAWHPISHKAGVTAPVACVPGQVFFDTDAAAGQNWFGCTSLDTWTLLSGGSATAPGGANGNVQFNKVGAFGGDSGLSYVLGTQTATIQNLTVPGTLTATLSGNASGSAASITGNLTGDVVSTGMATTLATSVSRYNFAAQTPGGTLNGGAPNTVTLTPMPLGVNHDDAAHYLYISGGTGTAEAVLITGGAGHAGDPTGTITFIPVYNHSGAFNIASATGGIQEAVQASGEPAVIRIAIPDWEATGPIYFHAPVTISKNITIEGHGPGGWMVQRASDFTTGDMFFISGAGKEVWFRDLSIHGGNNIPTSGAGIFYNTGTTARVSNVQIFNGRYGLFLNGTSFSNIDDFLYMNGDMTYKAISGIQITGMAVNTYINRSLSFGYPLTNANVLQYGIIINNADGVWVTNSGFAGDTGIAVTSVTPDYTVNLQFVGCQVDGARSYVLTIAGTGAFGGIRFNDCHFHSQGLTFPAVGPVVAIAYGPTINAGDIEFTGGWIAGGSINGLWIGQNAGTGYIRINGVSITDNNLSNTAAIGAVQIVDGATRVQVTNCPIYNTTGTGHQKYGIVIAGALTDGMISGNSLYNNDTAPLVVGGALTRVVLSENQGIDDVIGTVASGATIAAPMNPTFEVTGTTTVTKITGGWIGREIALVFTNAAPGGVATGGSGAGRIAKTQTVAQNQMLSLVFDGTYWYPGGGGGSGGGGGLGDPGSNGMVGRVAVNTTVSRTLEAGAGILVVNGDLQAGNPTVSADTATMLSRAQGQAGTDTVAIPASASGTVFTATLLPVLTAYTNGMALKFRPDVNCTGTPATLNIDTLGAKKLFGADGATSMACLAGLDYAISYDAALDTAAGAFKELVSTPLFANAAQTTAGSSAALAVTPDGLAGSTIFGTRTVQLEVFGPIDDVATGDGKIYSVVPPGLNGMNLVGVKAQVITASTSGVPTVQITRCAYAATGNACSGVGDDMLSTRMTIDINENSTTSAAAAAVIDATKDDVATDQIIRVDVDVAGTGTKGLIVTLIFQLP
ncbi:MAG: hypothetical protein V1790_17600 [Planctomycetota bacterium]